MYTGKVTCLFIFKREKLVFVSGQLHFHGSPTDIGYGSIYGKCHGSLADRRVWGGNAEKVSDLRMRYGFLSG